MSLATQNPSSKITPIDNHKFISDDAMQVRFLRNKSTLALRNCSSNFTSFNHTNLDSRHAARVRFNQNYLTPAQQNTKTVKVSLY